jgi:hypothetical protein
MLLAQAIRKPVSSGKNIGLGQRGKSSRVLYNYFMQSIPETAQPFFQEYEFERLNLERDGDLIIERLLAFGNRDEVRWLLIHYGQDNVRRWLSESGIRRLPRRRYKLWCVLLNVVESQRESNLIWPY